jgi:antitoxin PrlF
MVEEVKVTRNYQVTIPASARAKMGVKVGDVLVADYQDSKIVLEKKSSDITKLKIRLGKKISWRDVEETVREAGEKIAEGRRS